MVHLTGVKGQERKNENANQGEYFTIFGKRYNKAAVVRESVFNVVQNSKFKVNNDICEGRT